MTCLNGESTAVHVIVPSPHRMCGVSLARKKLRVERRRRPSGSCAADVRVVGAACEGVEHDEGLLSGPGGPGVRVCVWIRLGGVPQDPLIISLRYWWQYLQENKTKTIYPAVIGRGKNN